MKDVLPDQLTFANFSGLLNSRFQVCIDHANTVKIKLTEATRGDTSNPQVENFSLIFEGPVQPVLAQRIYSFEHDEFGRFDLFIVPMGQNQHGTQYQAVFNRLIKAP